MSRILLKARMPKKTKGFESRIQAAKDAASKHEHESKLHSILGHSDHKKAIKDHNAGKHEHLTRTNKGLAFRSAMQLHRHYKKRAGRDS